MLITKDAVAQKITAYLHHQLQLTDLVNWAEDLVQDGDISEREFQSIRDGVARLGVADVRAFGLTWEDCEHLLNRLGYNAQVRVEPA